MSGRCLLRVLLAGRTSSVPHARHSVGEILGAWGHDEIDNALLAVSEIVANAVTHTRSRLVGGCVLVEVFERGAGVVELRVTDEGADGVPLPREPDWDCPHGRGLWLLGQLAEEWGYEFHEGHGTVWAVVLVRAGCLSVAGQVSHG